MVVNQIKYCVHFDWTLTRTSDGTRPEPELVSFVPRYMDGKTRLYPSDNARVTIHEKLVDYIHNPENWPVDDHGDMDDYNYERWR